MDGGLMSGPVINGYSQAGDVRRPAERVRAEALSSDPVDVLVVDDLATNRKVLRHVVEKCGSVRVETCGSGGEAVRLCRERNFDLVLMDLHMPGMTGFEAGAEIVAARDGPLPMVVAQTADETPRACRTTGEMGFDGHLVKPIRPERIRAILAAIRRVAVRTPRT